jgi:hypothetical protein
MADKKFICKNFNDSTDCPYEITEDESIIVNTATDHEVEEHGYQDSPILRKQISDSLVPAS